MAYTGSVQDYMTPSPYSIGPHESVAAARVLMQRYGIRHLPVVDGADLVGVLSERDLKLIEGLPSREVAQLRVSDVMTAEPYVAPPTAPLTQTARDMGKQRYGCAVVLDRRKVVGILTTTDALFALVDALEGKTVRPAYEREADGTPPRGRTRPLTPPQGSRRSGQ